MKSNSRLGFGFAVSMVAVLFFVATPVAAAPIQQQSETSPSLDTFLLWLVAGGSVIAVSWVMERVTWFQTLTPDQKRLFQYVSSSLLGIGALLVQLYVPPSVLESLAPFFAVLVSTFGMVFLNQAAHSLDPAKKS